MSCTSHARDGVHSKMSLSRLRTSTGSPDGAGLPRRVTAKHIRSAHVVRRSIADNHSHGPPGPDAVPDECSGRYLRARWLGAGSDHPHRVCAPATPSGRTSTHPIWAVPQQYKTRGGSVGRDTRTSPGAQPATSVRAHRRGRRIRGPGRERVLHTGSHRRLEFRARGRCFDSACGSATGTRTRTHPSMGGGCTHTQEGALVGGIRSHHPSAVLHRVRMDPRRTLTG